MNSSVFDLLIIEDKEEVQDYIKDRVMENYSYDIIKSFEEAKEKLAAQQYKIICLNLEILKKNSLSKAHGRDVLILLKRKYSQLPVVLITGYPIDEDNYPKRYPNIKKVIKKDSIEKIQDIISELYESLCFEILIIDDEGKWQEIVLNLFDGVFHYDMISSDNALESIKNHRYKVVCAYLSTTQNLLKYRKLLCFLKKDNPELPLIFITDHCSNDDSNFLLRYPNIKHIIYIHEPNVIDKLEDVIIPFVTEKGGNMIDELPKKIQSESSQPVAEHTEKYTDFDLHIGPDGHITAHSNEGERTAEISVAVPDDVELTLDLIEGNKTNENLLKNLGKQLYKIIFPASVHTHFNQTEAVARSRNQKFRFRLTIEPDALAGLPWEFLYREEGSYFLSANPNTVLSHYLKLPLPQNRVRRREAPLDMLLIIANPSDQIPLDPDKWEKIITDALSEPLQNGTITIRTIKQATRKEIGNALLKQQPDIVQFVGHGIYHDSKGYLALVDKSGKTWEVDDERFSNIFLGADEHLGLVCLATCESAKSDSPQSFLGIAPKIVQKGVPAVVAMRYQVLISTAEIFLEAFYNAIAEHKPVDWAVQWARNQVSLDKGLDNREFATPVLFMRAEDGNIF